MIPKKIRRTITVNGNDYEYSVRGVWDRHIFIKNITMNKSKRLYYAFDMEVKPFDIREIIINNNI
jgi:hypothetical protein